MQSNSGKRKQVFSFISTLTFLILSVFFLLNNGFKNRSLFKISFDYDIDQTKNKPESIKGNLSNNTNKQSTQKNSSKTTNGEENIDANLADETHEDRDSVISLPIILSKVIRTDIDQYISHYKRCPNNFEDIRRDENYFQKEGVVKSLKIINKNNECIIDIELQSINNNTIYLKNKHMIFKRSPEINNDISWSCIAPFKHENLNQYNCKNL